MVKTSDFESENSGSSPGEAAKDNLTIGVVDLFNFTEEAEMPLEDAIRTLTAALEQIPPEFRKSALLTLRTYGDYANASVEVVFSRPETDEELDARKRRLDDRMSQREAEERRTLERLRAKYG